MSGPLRVFLAALAIAALALAGAVYLGYRSRLISAPHSGDVFNLASRGNIAAYLHDPRMDESLVAITLQRVEQSYYQPVNVGSLLKGEHTALVSLLAQHHLTDISLPSPSAGLDRSAQLSLAERELGAAEHRYGVQLGTKGDDELTTVALSGMLAPLHDPYTVYLSPRQIRSLNESLSGGNFGGIGVYIEPAKNGDVFVAPIAGMPAARAGMKTGQVVDAVNGQSIGHLSLDRVEQLIRGPVGSIVRIQTHDFDHPKVTHTYSIVRRTIHVPTVYSKMINGFDYIHLADFGETSTAEVRKALLNGIAHHAKGYILDLRDDGGGLLETAIGVSSLFIKHGVIVSTIKRDGSHNDQEARGTAIGGIRPLAVLVNQYTASASEITAGAIQDYKAGILVGTKTFGKGVVQSIYALPNDGALKITTARYLTPLGRDIEHRGIEPNIIVRQSADPALFGTPADKQLATAEAELQRRRHPTR